MNPVLHGNGGLVVPAQYLLGWYVWPFAVQLTGANLVCNAPLTTGTTLALEVGGTLTGDVITVPADPAGGQAIQSLQLGNLVPPNQGVRWLVTAGPADVESMATACSITMSMAPQSAAIVSVPPTSLQVAYNAGAGRTIFFNYQPATHFYAPTPDAAGYAAFLVGPVDQSLAILIGASEALAVAGGVMTVSQLIALGGVATTEAPRLEFLINGNRIATLAASATFRVANVTEGPVTPGDVAFEFYSGGILTATLDATGLTALQITEDQNF